MKIKIIKAVVANKAVHRKDAIIEVDQDLGKQLVADKFAIEEKAQAMKKEPESVTLTREGLLQEFGRASKKDLLETKADAEAKLAGDPKREDAKLVLEVVTDLLAKK